MDIEIEKDVPVQSKKYKTNLSEFEQFLSELNKGDSFFLEADEQYKKIINNEKLKTVRSVQDCLSRHSKLLSRKYITRRAYKGELFGMRVWRVK